MVERQCSQLISVRRVLQYGLSRKRSFLVCDRRGVLVLDADPVQWKPPVVSLPTRLGNKCATVDTDRVVSNRLQAIQHEVRFASAVPVTTSSLVVLSGGSAVKCWLTQNELEVDNSSPPGNRRGAQSKGKYPQCGTSAMACSQSRQGPTGATDSARIEHTAGGHLYVAIPARGDLRVLVRPEGIFAPCTAPKWRSVTGQSYALGACLGLQP